MAERLNKRHQEMIREKIRGSQLVNRLENHVLDDLELSPTQVTAALGLLRKVVPDLKATEHSGETTIIHKGKPLEFCDSEAPEKA